jgi:hypothetical protein
MNQPQAVRPGAAKRGPQPQQIRQHATAAGAALREVSLTRRGNDYKRKPSFISRCLASGMVVPGVLPSWREACGRNGVFFNFFLFFFQKIVFFGQFCDTIIYSDI